MEKKLQKEYQASIRPGMEVFAADKSRIGRVEKVRVDDFLLNRYGAAAVFVPFSFIDKVDVAVTITIPEGKIMEMDWPGVDADVDIVKPAGGEPRKP